MMSELVKASEMVEGRYYTRDGKFVYQFRDGARYTATNVRQLDSGSFNDWREVCKHGKAVDRSANPPIVSCEQKCWLSFHHSDCQCGNCRAAATENGAKREIANPGRYVSAFMKGLRAVQAEDVSKSLPERWRAEAEKGKDCKYQYGPRAMLHALADELEQRHPGHVAGIPDDQLFLVLTDHNITSADQLRKRMEERAKWEKHIMDRKSTMGAFQSVMADHEIIDAEQLSERLSAKDVDVSGLAAVKMFQEQAEKAEAKLKSVISELASIKALKALETTDSFPAGDITRHRVPPRGPQIGYEQGYDGDET